MQERLDDIDRRILYYLRVGAKNTTAPMIAEKVDVSPATIPNRINWLEKREVVQGYYADLDYEKAEGNLMNILFSVILQQNPPTLSPAFCRFRM